MLNMTINRKKLVHKHNPVKTSTKPHAPHTVGESLQKPTGNYSLVTVRIAKILHS